MPLDDEPTDPLAGASDIERVRYHLAEIRATQAAAAGAVRRALVAEALRAEAIALRQDTLRAWLQPGQWVDLARELPWQARVLVVVAAGLALLQVAGVEVQLGELSDSAAHAWTGEPHRCVESVP